MKKYLPEILMTIVTILAFIASTCEKAPMPFHALYVVFAVIGGITVFGMLLYSGIALLGKLHDVSHYFFVMFMITLFILVMIGLNAIPPFMNKT